MKRFVLTGAPGAGKSVILRQLELDGFSVVEEAATDLIALAQARALLNRGCIPRSSIRSLICRDSASFARPASLMGYSSTIDLPSAPLPWRCTLVTRFRTRFREN